MKAGPECLQCLKEQAKRSLSFSGVNGEILESMIRFVDEIFGEDKIPANLGTILHRRIMEIIGGDPYKEKKRTSNREALKLEGYARELIRRAENPLLQSFKVALAGNLLDFSISDVRVNVEELKKALNDGFEVDDSGELLKFLENASTVLYLCDNAGEIAFDKLCILELQTMGLEVTAAVKSGPILNDATMEDALAVGLPEVCEVITIGSNCVGVNLEEASKEFIQRFKSFDLIIAKGQGNYETLGDVNKDILFLLKAKCLPVARALGVGLKGSVLFFNRACL
jgi:hypothetical protein